MGRCPLAYGNIEIYKGEKMIYITGDTHIPIDIHKLNSKNFSPAGEDNYLIICGDFGGVWDGGAEDKYWQKWLGEKNFTTLFVDGNHENFDMLEALPEKELFGGRVHCINDKVFHLMRGQIFTIEGKSFFTLGGARSHDRGYRVAGISWWKQELPTQQELDLATQRLEAANWQVDYVITHCAPYSVQSMIKPEYDTDILIDYLGEIKEKLSYKKWFFGHYHTDSSLDPKHRALYNDIIELS